MKRSPTRSRASARFDIVWAVSHESVKLRHWRIALPNTNASELRTVSTCEPTTSTVSVSDIPTVKKSATAGSHGHDRRQGHVPGTVAQSASFQVGRKLYYRGNTHSFEQEQEQEQERSCALTVSQRPKECRSSAWTTPRSRARAERMKLRLVAPGSVVPAYVSWKATDTRYVTGNSRQGVCASIATSAKFSLSRILREGERRYARRAMSTIRLICYMNAAAGRFECHATTRRGVGPFGL